MPVNVAPAAEPEQPAPKVEVLPATASVPEPEQPPTDKNHSVNINPFGAIAGDYAIVYQWSFARSHGLVAELTGTWQTNDGRTSKGFGAQLGYRHFTNGTADSWFFGAMAGYDIGSSVGSTTTASLNAELTVTRRYELPYRRWRATATVGRRWVFGPGFNVTVRAGIGAGQRVYARGTQPEANHEAATMETVVNFLPISVDSELSVGWLF